MAFTAKDVQALRQSTGAGMMDAKKALQANDGDFEAAKQWLREQGLAASAKRDERENTQGVVALVVDGQVGAMVELKSETDFVVVSLFGDADGREAARSKRVMASGLWRCGRNTSRWISVAIRIPATDGPTIAAS